MGQIYTTVVNDRLDKICEQVYGTEHGGIVEAVLRANTGLATLGTILPGGVEIVLPSIQPQKVSVVPTVKLWGTK